MSRWLEKYYMIFFAVILVFASFNVFFNLSSTQVNNFDEPRHGVSAYDMIESKNIIKTTYLGETDYWYLKPPLGIWIIAISYKIFGYNIFALRLPSALSTLFCIILTMLIVKRYFSTPTSILSGLILTTSVPFVLNHSARTGDLDAQITLLTLLSVLFFQKYLDSKKGYFFYLTGFIVALAFLLKSFAFVMPLGVIIAYLLITKEFRKISFRRYLVFSVALLLPIIIWAIARYIQDGTKFFVEMVRYDLLKRSSEAIEGHAGHFLFYFKILLLQYFPWVLFLFIIPFYKNEYKFEQDDERNQISVTFNKFYDNLLYALWIIVPFIIATIVKTKSDWYINPIYPPLALLISWHIYDIIKNQRKVLIKSFLILSFVILPFAYSEYAIVSSIKSKNNNKLQLALLALDESKYVKKSEIYGFQAWNPAESLISYVVRELKPKQINDINEFIVGGGNALLVLKKTNDNLEMLSKYSFEILNQNDEWIIVKKGDKSN